MTIEVTAEDIELGRRCVSRECPVARAVMRAFDEADIQHWHLQAGNGHITWRSTKDLGEDIRAVPLPAKVVRWIKEFDLAIPVYPITFEMENIP